MFSIGGDTLLPQEPSENLYVKFEVTRGAKAHEIPVRDAG